MGSVFLAGGACFAFGFERRGADGTFPDIVFAMARLWCWCKSTGEFKIREVILIDRATLSKNGKRSVCPRVSEFPSKHSHRHCKDCDSNITIILNGASYPVRSQTWSVSAPGSGSFGHGTISNSIASPGGGTDVSASR